MTTKYIEIYENLRQDIESGNYKKGEKLPSKRVISENFSVSLITVEHACELLIEEGYIQAKERSGYYVIYDYEPEHLSPDYPDYPPAEKNNLPDEPKKKDPLSFSFAIYAKTVRRVLSSVNLKLLEKSPAEGIWALREAISVYLKRSGKISALPDQIIIGAGAEYLYGLIVEALGRDKIYALEFPSYEKIAEVYTAGGAEIKLLSLGNNGIVSKDLWESKADVLHITPYRSFPSGVTATVSKKHEYLRWCEKSDRYIVEDDFESEFTKSRKAEETLFSLDKNSRVIYVNTFTKTIGPYIRTAYMVIPRNLIETFKIKTGFYSCPVPTLEQYVITELINNRDFERHINRVRRLARVR